AVQGIGVVDTREPGEDFGPVGGVKGDLLLDRVVAACAVVGGRKALIVVGKRAGFGIDRRDVQGVGKAGGGVIDHAPGPGQRDELQDHVGLYLFDLQLCVNQVAVEVIDGLDRLGQAAD